MNPNLRATESRVSSIEFIPWEGEPHTACAVFMADVLPTPDSFETMDKMPPGMPVNGSRGDANALDKTAIKAGLFCSIRNLATRSHGSGAPWGMYSFAMALNSLQVLTPLRVVPSV